MKTFIKSALSCLCFSLLFFSCSDDKNERSEGSKLTPDQNKEKLESIGLKVIGKINPADHKDLLETIDVFSKLLDEGELSIEGRQQAGSIIKNIRGICSKANLGKMITFTAVEPDLFVIEDYYGIYTYNESRQEWERLDSDSKLEFRFNAGGVKSVLTFVCSGNKTIVDIDDETKVEIPEKLEATLMRGEKALFNLAINNKINKSSHSVTASAELSASGYVYSVSVEAGMEMAKSNFELKKGTEVLISSANQVSGKSLTNPSESEMDAPETMFKSAMTEVSVMNEMNIKASCSNIGSMIDDIENLRGDSESEVYNVKLAEMINKYMDVGMKYTDSDDKIANIKMQPYRDEWLDYYGGPQIYWDVEPVIVFTVDNSSYSLESYFNEVDFSDLINGAERLYRQYTSYIDYLF